MKKSDQLSRRSFIKLFGAASVATAGLALAGCDGQKKAEEKPAADSGEAKGSDYEPATVRVAFMPNLGSAASLFSGIEQGYFDEVGITVETSQFDAGPAEISAMQSGDIDIAQIGHGAHALCIEGQAKIFAFDQLSKADSVIANKAKGITTAADLKGKTIGVASGTSSEIVLEFVLRDAGLTKDDVTLSEMKVDGMTTALIAGQIDAAATWSPNTVTIKEQLGDNYVLLGNNADYAGEVAFPSSFICLSDYAEKNKDILVRFGAALDKAKVWRDANIDDAAKLLASKLGLPEETLLQATGEGDWATAVEVIGDTPAITAYYEAQQKVFLDNGRIPAAVPVADYLLSDIITESDELYETKLK